MHTITILINTHTYDNKCYTSTQHIKLIVVLTITQKIYLARILTISQNSKYPMLYQTK